MVAPQRACRPVRVQAGGCTEVFCIFFMSPNIWFRLWVSIIRLKLENMETHHMMGIHHVENSDKNKSTFTFLNTLLHSKVCCSSVHEIRVRRRRTFRTAGFVMQNFPDNASKLRQLAFYGDAKWHRLHYFALSLLFIFKCAFKLVGLGVASSHLVHFWDLSLLFDSQCVLNLYLYLYLSLYFYLYVYLNL